MLISATGLSGSVLVSRCRGKSKAEDLTSIVSYRKSSPDLNCT